MSHEFNLPHQTTEYRFWSWLSDVIQVTVWATLSPRRGHEQEKKMNADRVKLPAWIRKG